MKSRIILNILLAYFVILSLLLLVQISSSKETKAVEPLSSELTYKDRLNSAVVLSIGSPVAIINEKQFLIDDDDSTTTPIIEDGKVYIPAILLKTAFNANISFSKETKETIIRLNNMAIIFSNHMNTITVLDNTSKKVLELDTESKIINDRFYLPLRSFADIFEKQVFYNNDLIVISNIKDIFDPIEEIETIEKLLNQVKQLPIVGNNDNLKKLNNNINISTTNEFFEPKYDLLNIENLAENLKTSERLIIKKTNNFNFYITEGFIEAYFVNSENKEIFSFKVEKVNNDIKDLQITDTRFVISYEQDGVLTYIYDISDREKIEPLKVYKNNGNFYKNIIDGNNLYIISKMDISKDKMTNPIFYNYNFDDYIYGEIVEENFEYEDILYFPDMNDGRYTLLSYINLYDTRDNVFNKVYLGMGNKIIVNEDLIYVLTNKNDNNNLYLFKIGTNDIEYIKRDFIKGDISNIYFNELSQKLEVFTDNEIIYFNKELTEKEISTPF